MNRKKPVMAIDKVLIIVMLLQPSNLLAASKNGNFFAGILGIIGIVIFAIFGYVVMIGFFENRKRPNGESGSLGCMMLLCIISIIVILSAFINRCS